MTIRYRRVNSVSTRLIVMLVVASTCFAALALVNWWQFDRGFAALRAETSGRALQRLEGIHDMEAAPIATFTRSFSWWDELCTAINTRDQAWMRLNIDPVAKDFDLDGIVVATADGTVVHQIGVAGPVLSKLVAELGVAAAVAQRTGGCSGWDGTTLVDMAFATVHRTADVSRTDPPQGLLLAGRRWTPERLQRLSVLFADPVTLEPAGGGAPASSAKGAVRISHDLSGPSGQRVAQLVGHRHLPALADLERQSWRHLWLSPIIGIACLVALALGGHLLAGLPLRRLAKALAQREAATMVRLAARSDEVGLAAEAGVIALEQRRQLDEEVEHRREAESKLRHAHDRLARELADHQATAEARSTAESRTALALQGGNLCLWEYDVAGANWVLDLDWLAFHGVQIDPTRTTADAWMESIVPEDAMLLVRQIAAVAGGGGGIELTFRLRRAEDVPLWVMMRGIVAEMDEQGHAVRIAGTMLDISRWRELEQQLRHAQKLESVGQLAAGIAHEINTPIQFIGDNTRFCSDSFQAMSTLIATYRQLLADDSSDEAREAEVRADLPYLLEEVPKALTQTLEGVERVTTIVRAMKEFAHPANSELQPADLNHLVETTVTISRNAWKYVAELTTDLDPALPPVPLAIGDFNTVLLNLIVNAAQAIEDAHRGTAGHIRITSRVEGEQAVLSVADDGCGIPEAIMGRIYDPFFTTKAVGRGSGQGLAIARGVVVEKHGGSLDCTSQPGVGTTFTIRLPLKLREGRP